MIPEKVNRLILVAASCGGKGSIPKPPQFSKLIDCWSAPLDSLSTDSKSSCIILPIYSNGIFVSIAVIARIIAGMHSGVLADPYLCDKPGNPSAYRID